MTDVCRTGKQGYDTQSAAAKAKRAVNQKTTTRYGSSVSVYRCRACGQWHIGRER